MVKFFVSAVLGSQLKNILVIKCWDAILLHKAVLYLSL